MKKREELSNPNSCTSRSKDDEMLFVLTGRDICAPETIQCWINLRIKSGKNQADDSQIREAAACAEEMRRQQDNGMDELDKPCSKGLPSPAFNHDTSHTYGKPDFWKQHESALRAGRITQAAAIIFADTRFNMEEAVNRAFMIDQEVQNKIKQEKA